MAPLTKPRDWQTVTLGFQGIPYPTSQPDGSLTLSPDYVPLIYSTRTAEEANGVAFRDMPAPEHLPYFLNLLDAINQKGRRVFMFLSEPGVGKSFMADVVSNMMIGDKALRYECGDKRLGDLLFTTDLTERPEQTLYDRVLLKVKEGKLHPLSLARLEDVLGESFDSTEGTVDWKKLVTNKTIVADVDDVFKSVAQAEGLSQQATIALREDNGLIIQAYEQDRIALADEYNKGKPGSDTALQTTLQWLAREGQPHIEVQSSSGRSYELDGLDGKPGFFVIMTGNATSDGLGTFELSQSQYSRLQPSYLPSLGKLGLSHRFCQVMTGLPLTTLHKLYGPHFENNDEGFVLFCKGLRTLGLSQQEVERIPPHQMALLDNPMQVIEAADKCAELFLRWQNKTNLNNTNLPTNLMAELTEDYVKANAPDPRLFIMLFNRALERAERRAVKDKTVNPSFIFTPVTAEDLATTGSVNRIGSALMELVAEEIKNKTPQQPNLRGILMSDAAELGLLPAAQQKQQGNKVKNLAELLNFKTAAAVPVNYDATRDLIKGWAALFGSPVGAQDGEQLTPFLPSIERTLSLLKADKDHFISFLPDATEVDLTQPQGPFQLSNVRKVEFERHGTDTFLVGDEERKPFESSRLLKANQLIASLTIPNNEETFLSRYQAASKEQRKPLQAFSLVVADDKNPEEEKTLIVLRSEVSPLRPGSTVAWKDDIRPATVIIGDGPIPAELEKRLQASSKKPSRTIISYVDASQPNGAAGFIMDALRREASSKPELTAQLTAILEPAAMSRVNSAAQPSAFQRASAGITGRGADPDSAKIEGAIKEILKGEAIQVGYVAVTSPTRTADLMKGLRNIQAARPNGAGAKADPNGGPGGTR